LCDQLSKATHIPNKAIVQRIKHTLAQTQLDKQRRIENVDNAFKCDVVLNLKHIAVIDDVITTGVTINAVCRAIKTHNPTVKISVMDHGYYVIELKSTLITKHNMSCPGCLRVYMVLGFY